MRAARIAMLGLLLALPGVGPAGAAPPSASPLAAVLRAAPPLEEVRWAVRCRPVVMHRRDRFGRPVRIVRERCERVWVGQGRPRPPRGYGPQDRRPRGPAYRPHGPGYGPPGWFYR